MLIVRRVILSLLTVVIVVAGLLVVRQALAPESVPPPVVELTPDDASRLEALSDEARVDARELRDAIKRADVVLVGEVHFYRETMQYLTTLIDAVDNRQVSLLLELPSGLQPRIDSFLETGDETILDSIFGERAVLPYRDILVWVAANRGRVPVVVAMDENRSRIVVNRALLRDTRNETMARHVSSERKRHPDHLVVAYGGQLHLLMAGRYRFDVDNRVPMGARLANHGIARERVVSIMLSGDGEAPLCDIVEAGIFAARSDLGDENYPMFVGGKIYGAESGRELFDYFVDLGTLTPVSP